MSTCLVLVLYGHGELVGGETPRKDICFWGTSCPGINNENSLWPGGNQKYYHEAKHHDASSLFRLLETQQLSDFIGNRFSAIADGNSFIFHGHLWDKFHNEFQVCVQLPV